MLVLAGSREQVRKMLEEMAEMFKQKIPPDFAFCVNLEVSTSEHDGAAYCYHVVCGSQNAELGDGKAHNALLTLTLDTHTLANLASGKWSGLTAAGRARARDSAPLDFVLPEGVDASQVMPTAIFFLTHFFNRHNPTRFKFGPEHVRKVHGAGAAVLFYAPGLRSAYYAVFPEDRANADMATDPFFQAFIVIGGEGRATIGQNTFPVSKGDVLYIPPDHIHILETDGPEPLEVIWLAWGAKA